MASKKIGLVLALDGEKEFIQAIQTAKKEASLFETQIKGLSEEFEGNANSVEYLQRKQELLSKKQETYQRSLSAARDGLKRANDNYREQCNRLEELEKELENARDALEEMSEAGQKGTKAYEDQEKSVKALEKAVAAQRTARTKESGSIADWNKKIYESEKALNRSNQELSRNEQYLNEARSSANQCASSIDEFGNEVREAAEEVEKFNSESSSVEDGMSAIGESTGNVTQVMTSLGEKVGQGLVTKGIDLATEAFGKLVEKVKEVATESDRASSQLQAATGLSDEMAEKYSAVMDSIRGDNFGEDYDDVADVMSQIVRIMGELDSSKMKETAENAITLRDTFGMDYNETIRAVNSLMKNMGLTAQEAFDYITKGAQTGLDRSGELVDNITEYSQLWGQAGFSAEEMFAILDNGLQNGAYNLDKVNDFVKEFGISLSDGRIEESIDSFSAKSQELFASYQKGEADVKDVFYSIISDLSEMENEQTALTLASNVWSSLGEDNAMKVIASLDDVNTKYNNVRGAAEELKEVKYDDLESSIEALGQTMTEKLVTPIVDVAVPAVKEAVDWLNNALTIEPEPSVINDAWSVFENNRDSLAGLKTAREQDAAATDIQTASIDAYKTKLMELQSVEEKDGAYKAELAQTMMEMGSLIPEIADAYDAEAYSLDLTAEQVEQYAEAAKNAAMANAALAEQDSLTESINNTNQALTAAEVLLGDIQNIKKERPLTIDEEMDEASLQEWVKYLKDELEVYEKELESSQKASGELAKANEELAESANNVGEAQEETAKSTAQVAAEYKAMGYTSGEAARMAEDYAEKLEKIQEASKKRADAEREAAEIQKSAMESVKDVYDETVQSIASDIQNKISVFDKFDGGTDMTTEEMNANLESQLEGLKKYQENLEKVGEMVNEEGKSIVSPEFLQYIKDLGPEGANMLEHMVWTWENQGEDGKKQIQSMNDQYCELMDISDEISEAGAANEMAYKASIKGFVSSDEEFTSLQESIDYAVKYAGEAWSGMSESTKEELENTIKTVQECGGQIPEGLAEAIESGETGPGEAIDQMNASLLGYFDGLVEAAEESGIEVDEKLRDGVESGGEEAVKAFQELIAALSEETGNLQDVGEEAGNEQAEGIRNASGEVESASEEITSAGAAASEEKAEEYKEAGAELANAEAEGIRSGQTNVESAAGQIAQAAAESASQGKNDFIQVGYNMSAGMADGLIQGAPLIQEAARKVVSDAKEAAQDEADEHSPSVVWRDEIGANLTKGAAQGILEEADTLNSAAREVMEGAEKAAKDQADINSPSGVWLRTIGKMLTAGAAEGVEAGSGKLNAAVDRTITKATEKALEAVKSGKKELDKELNSSLSSKTTKKIESNFGVSKKDSSGKVKSDAAYYAEVYSEAKKYANNIESLYGMSLGRQEEYWKQVKKSLKKGTQAWYDAAKELKSVQKQIRQQKKETDNQLIADTEEYFRKREIKGKEDALYELEYWETIKNSVKKGSDAWYDALEHVNDARDKIVSEGQEYIRRQKITGEVSIEEEIAYWENILTLLNKGTDAWYDVMEIINDLKEEQAQEAEEAANMAAEEAARKEKEVLSTRASVQEKLLSGYKTYYKTSLRAEMEYWNIARQQFAKGTEERIEADQKYYEAKEAYYDRLEELEQEYVDNTKAVDEQLRDNIQSLTDEYENAVESRADAIKSSFGLFDEFSSESESGAKLLSNLKSQVAGIADWEKELAKLGARGISEGLLEELQALGPEASASIHALNTLTAEELEEYDNLWNQRNALAESQAVLENEDLRKETQEKIDQAKEEAQSQLDEYAKAYKEETAEVMEGISSELKQLAYAAANATEEAVAGMIAGISKAVDMDPVLEKVGGAVTTISSELGKLSQAGEVIGTDALTALMDGLTDEEVIAAKSQSLYEQMRTVYEEEAKLASNTFAAELQKRLEGAEIGVEDLNQAISKTVNYNPVISLTTNVATLETKMDQLIALAEQYYPQMAEKGDITLDGDLVTAKLQKKISQQMAETLTYTR